MTLWDNFSNGLKKSTIESHLKPANIFKFHNTQSNPPKIKFITLIANRKDAVNESFAYLFINSNINQQIYGKHHELIQLHEIILKSDYDFLEHNSYIDCNKIYEINQDELYRRCEENIGIYSGTLNNIDFQKVIQKVKKSTCIKNELKTAYDLI